MSMRHLNRMFRAATGQSIRQYLVRRQLETAEMLLLTSNCSITEFAQAVHFKSATYFSRFFHHYLGISPTEFPDAITTISFINLAIMARSRFAKQ